MPFSAASPVTAFAMRYTTVQAMLVLVTLALPSTVLAQNASRAEKFEFSVYPLLTQSKNYQSSNGASADLDNGRGLGFAWGFNVDNQWQVGVEVEWMSADYIATATPGQGNPGPNSTFSSTLETSTIRVAGTYHWNAKPTTLFFTGGLGFTHTDTGIPDGAPVFACWWYPYWGEVCGVGQPTKSQTDFSYNAGIGLRWDSSSSGFFVRGLFNRQWVDFGEAAGTIYYSQYRVDFGTRF